jgi:ATP-dependent DNA helicase
MEREEEQEAAENARRERDHPPNQAGTAQLSSYFDKRQVAARAGRKNESTQDANVNSGTQSPKSSRQPATVTGGTMRKYQLEGLEWMKTLYENGLNGILADEMGLGKTVQTISLLAFLREMETYGPFLVVAPLSTTTNWVDEFHMWTPSIPVVLYHGGKDERAELRSVHFGDPRSKNFPVIVTSYEICMNDRKYLSAFKWQFLIIVSTAVEV